MNTLYSIGITIIRRVNEIIRKKAAIRVIVTRSHKISLLYCALFIVRSRVAELNNRFASYDHFEQLVFGAAAYVSKMAGKEPPARVVFHHFHGRYFIAILGDSFLLESYQNTIT